MPNTRIFAKQFLIDTINQDGGAIIIQDEIVDTSRWSIIHKLIFAYDNKFWKVTYSVGATEVQDETPFQYDPPNIYCVEVIPVEVSTIIYQEV
jgi:hypothetical protein